ncbi:hypothetical protein A5706_10540 [Mycobacterium sp. E796]|nr:hypothetical protein A5706_10540 [Mycobacterium sp. E796]
MACPNCDHGAGCRECQSRRNCATHWQYLLKNTASRVFLQCPTCFFAWTVDTAAHDVHANDTLRAASPQPAADPDGAVIAKVWIGNHPRDIETSPDGELVYVMTTDSVKVVNSLHHVVASIPISEQEPKQMTMSSDGSRIYVTGYDGELSIIDPITMTSKNVARQRIAATAVSPDGSHIYLAHGNATIGGAWVESFRADGIPVAFVSVDGFVTGMATSPDGRHLYVASANHGDDGPDGSIAVIDTANYKAIGFLSVATAPESITVDANGLLYVTHFHTPSVTVVDPGTHRRIAVDVNDAPMQIVASPATDFCYTANAHSVTVIDTTTAATTSMMVGELPRRLSISPDGRRLYATDFAHGDLWCVDTSDHSVVTTVPVCSHPAAVKLSRNGEFLYVTDARDGTLSVVSTESLRRNSPNTA